MKRRTIRVSLLLASTLPALAAQPATEREQACARLQPGWERLKCSNDEIGALDRAVESAYATALVAIGHTGRSALKRDQAEYTRAREKAARSGDIDLSLMLSLRKDFLESVRVNSPGVWTGSWANANGTLEILAKGGGTFHVRLQAADPVAGAWLCEFDDSAILAPRGIAMIVGAESAADDFGGPNEGWTLALRLAGDILLVEPLRPKGSTGPIPFCNKGGNVAGNYFAQNHAPAINQTAGRN